MRFVPEKQLAKSNLESHETHFLECWYGLTHARSLDSYRVTCLNARSIVRELCDELDIGRLDEPEFLGICEEALSLLQDDPVVSVAFTRGFASLELFLTTPPLLPGSSQKKEKQNPDNQTRLRDLTFAATDLAASLDARYFATLCNRLKDALGQKDISQVEPLTNAILSDLVSRGWTLAALFEWHRKFLAADGRSFGENLDFMLRQLKRPLDEFDVTLRISGGKNVRQLSSFGSFKLSTECTLHAGQSYEQKFVTPDPFTTFATGIFRSVDFTTAAIVARDEIEPLLDSLRFQFEPRLLEIERECYVIRRGDQRRMIVNITNPVPNPVESFGETDFQVFSEQLSGILESATLDDESKNRIQTSLRRYRAGRDGQNYSDKFLNWWMGLETLASVGGLRIGRTVTENVSHAMLTGYTFRILRDLLITLKYLKIEWRDDFQNATGIGSLDSLDVPGLVKLLQASSLPATLWDLIKERPLVVARGKCIVDWINDPKKTSEKLKTHLQRLRWHINRLYRIRCCLVHGSPVRFRLALFCANLEYYLKQTLIFTLNALHEHPHIADLASLFQRTSVMWERQLKALEDKAADHATIADAVFASVATRD